MRKIGIMGGTFNPVHMGHLLLAEWAMDAAELEEVWFIPAGAPYKKSGLKILPGRERLRMTELAVADNPRFRCLDVEVKRPGYTYTYETLALLQSEHPDASFYFIAGADCLFSIETWKNPEKILSGCTLLAAVRDVSSMEEMEKKREALLARFGGSILLMPFLRMSVTSTEIRERIRGGRSVRYLVPQETLTYIEEKGFYRDEEDRQ